MAGGARDVLLAPHHECIIGVLDRGRGTLNTGRGRALWVRCLHHQHRCIGSHALGLHGAPHLRHDG